MDCIEEYKLAFEHTQKLEDRRQQLTSFYLSINALLGTAIGILFLDGQVVYVWELGTLLLVFTVGLVACHIWRVLLRQYKTLIGWWYARLRELEQSLPDSALLINREYADLYDSKPALRSNKLGFTESEVQITWLISILYAVLLVGGILLFVISNR